MKFGIFDLSYIDIKNRKTPDYGIAFCHLFNSGNYYKIITELNEKHKKEN
ncbi:hypothetical protein FHS70_003577 [Flammeovirga yaeyamensis]|nr:hypothetical protein [Flammeovirga yaeyamensis]